MDWYGPYCRKKMYIIYTWRCKLHFNDKFHLALPFGFACHLCSLWCGPLIRVFCTRMLVPKYLEPRLPGVLLRWGCTLAYRKRLNVLKKNGKQDKFFAKPIRSCKADIFLKCDFYIICPKKVAVISFYSEIKTNCWQCLSARHNWKDSKILKRR